MDADHHHRAVAARRGHRLRRRARATSSTTSRRICYKTTDYGQTWTKITNGIPSATSRASSAKTRKRRGLLYAGTETGLYVSFDDGANWQAVPGAPLAGAEGAPPTQPERTLPVVPIHDLIVHDTDLVLGTHGRSFWVLDDLSALRAWPDLAADARAELFPIRPTVRILPPHDWGHPKTVGYKTYINTGGSQATGVVRQTGDDTFVELLNAGANAPTGALVHYLVRGAAPEQAALSFWTADGQLIRRFTSADDQKELPRQMRVQTTPGLHRFVWDLRYPDATKLEGTALSLYWAAAPSGRSSRPARTRRGLRSASRAGRSASRCVRIRASAAATPDLQAQFELLLQIRDKLGEVHDAVAHSRQLREQINAWEARLKAGAQADVAQAAEQARDTLLEAENELVESAQPWRGRLVQLPTQGQQQARFAAIDRRVWRRASAATVLRRLQATERAR